MMPNNGQWYFYFAADRKSGKDPIPETLGQARERGQLAAHQQNGSWLLQKEPKR